MKNYFNYGVGILLTLTLFILFVAAFRYFIEISSDFHKRFRNYEFERKNVVVNKLDTSEVLIILEPKDRNFWEDSMVPEYYCLDKYGNKVDRYELQLKLTHR